MKRIITYTICILLLVSFVSASDLCKESDDGKDYAEEGYVKYGVTRYDDLCVLSPNKDMRLPESSFLKEYYCDDDERKNEIVECSRKGFEKCVDGKCIGGSTDGDSQTTTPVYIPACGNKKIDAGEDCDPPTKICYDDSDIGLCSTTCKCEIKIKADDSGTDEEDESETVVDDEPEEITDEEEVKEETKTVEKTVEDKDGISTQKDRLALPKEPKKGLFGRAWNWFLDIFR